MSISQAVYEAQIDRIAELEAEVGRVQMAFDSEQEEAKAWEKQALAVIAASQVLYADRRRLYEALGAAEYVLDEAESEAYAFDVEVNNGMSLEIYERRRGINQQVKAALAASPLSEEGE